METPAPRKLPILDQLRALHAQVSAEAVALEAQHADRLQCQRGCSDCCRDGITVFEVEAVRILSEASRVLGETPHPVGACAFLDGEGACRIYDVRPYVCRTQGLPLRWLEERDGATVELRDVCPKNEGPEHPALETLAPEACWTLGPTEARLANLQEASGQGLRRVPLRALFEPEA